MPKPDNASDNAAAAVTCPVEDLPTPDNSANKDYALAVDPTGSIVVGFSDLPDGDRGLMWRDGQLVDVAVPASSWVFRAVNSSGLVVGRADGRAFVHQDGWNWRLPGGGNSEAVDVNEDGIVAGNLIAGSPATRRPQWLVARNPMGLAPGLRHVS